MSIAWIGRRAALIASTAPFVAWATGVQAQEAPTSAAAESPLVYSNEDIVVTAQKREQTLIDIPQSISVVSGDVLETQQATSFQDYLKLVPGLQIEQNTPGQTRLVLRGVNTGGVASTVSVYLDETPFGSSSGLANGAILAGDFDTFDLARVEVLRGPQGTLYGASSLSGVVRFITNEPDTTRFIGRARAGVETVKGGDLSYSGSAVVNVPLGQTLAFRASGSYRKTGGFIDSIGTGGSDIEENINDSRSYGGRASLLFTPIEALELRLSAVLQNIEADAPTVVESDPNTLQTLYGRPTFSQFIPAFTDISYRLYNGTIDYDLGFASLLSSTSYSTQKQTGRTDVTNNLSALIAAVFGTPNELFLPQTTNNEKFTQEVRLASESSDIFEWLLGGYYTHEKGLIRQQYVAVAPGTLTPVVGLPLLADVRLESKYEEIAGFGNGTLHFGQYFDLDFGARYSHNSQNATQVSDGALAGGLVNFPDATSSENVFTYSVAPKIKFGDHASVYGRVAKGFRPGGPNVLPPGAPASVPTSFDSDSLTSYEIGLKAQSSDRTFGIDIAAYHLDWSDIQLLAVVNNFGVNVNGAGANIDGAEFTATLQPASGFVIALNGAYTDAKLADDTGPLVGGLKGDRLPFTPKYSIGINGDYRWALGGSTEAYFGGSLRFLSDQSGSFDPDYRAANGRQRSIDSYEVIDLRAGLDFGRVGIDVYAKNLGNSDGKTSTSAVTANGFPLYPNGAIGTGVIRPRSFGVSLTAEY